MAGDKSNSQHVVRSLRGGWDVKKTGAARASKHFDNREDAIEWARSVARNQRSEIYVHSEDGRISSKESCR